MDKVHTTSKAFTYAENRLLDQITLEITEAWKKDLAVLKKHYQTIIEIGESTQDIVDILDEKLPKLEKFLRSNEFISNFNRMQEEMETLNLRYGELNKTIFELEKKLNFDYVTSLTKSIKSLEDAVKEHLLKKTKKPWWKIF